MSIIERFAQLLDPVAQPTPRSSAPSSGPTSPELDLIERALVRELARPPAAANQAAERRPGPTPAQPAAPASRSARTVAIDLARLRRQGMVAPGGERTATAESFRRIKRRILANALNPKPNVPANLVLVTSALPGEGKTFCSINLAISIALEVDHSVLLVDADVRKPSIPAVLEVALGKGLLDLLVNRRMDLAEVLCRTNIGKLTLLPGGTPQGGRATELLASAATRELLGEMAARYHDRIIIFDSPPLLAASETSVLASQMGQVVMVVESGKTTESALKEALGQLDSSQLVGMVLNKASGPALQSYYGGYGSGA